MRTEKTDLLLLAGWWLWAGVSWKLCLRISSKQCSLSACSTSPWPACLVEIPAMGVYILYESRLSRFQRASAMGMYKWALWADCRYAYSSQTIEKRLALKRRVFECVQKKKQISTIRISCRSRTNEEQISQPTYLNNSVEYRVQHPPAPRFY